MSPVVDVDLMQRFRAVRDPHVAVGGALDRVSAAVDRVEVALAGARVDPGDSRDGVDAVVDPELEVVASGLVDRVDLPLVDNRARRRRPSGGGGTAKIGAGASGLNVLASVGISSSRVSG